MPFTIELSPETEARLKEAAQTQNVPIDQLIGQILEQSSFGTASNVGQNSNSVEAPLRKKYNIMDFEGIGAANAPKRDAQERISELRDEWDAP